MAKKNKINHLQVNWKNISKIACMTVVWSGLVYGGMSLSNNRPFYLDKVEKKQYDINIYSRNGFYRFTPLQDAFSLKDCYIYYIEPYHEVVSVNEENINVMGYQSNIYRFTVPNIYELDEDEIISIVNSNECDLCQMFGQPEIICNSYMNQDEYDNSGPKLLKEPVLCLIKNECNPSVSIYVSETLEDELWDQFYFFYSSLLGLPLSIASYEIIACFKEEKQLRKKID